MRKNGKSQYILVINVFLVSVYIPICASKTNKKQMWTHFEYVITMYYEFIIYETSTMLCCKRPLLAQNDKGKLWQFSWPSYPKVPSIHQLTRFRKLTCYTDTNILNGQLLFQDLFQPNEWSSSVQLYKSQYFYVWKRYRDYIIFIQITFYDFL